MLKVLRARVVDLAILLHGSTLIVGCSVYGPPPDELVASINAEIDHLDREHRDHRDAVQSATSLPAALKLEDEHIQHVSAAFDVIRRDLERLSACEVIYRRRPIPLDTSAVHDALQDVRAACDRHDSASRMAPNLPAMMEEEQRHASLMTDAISIT